MNLFGPDGTKMLPFDTNGTFLWPTADRKIINKIGDTIALEIPNGDDELFPIRAKDKEYLCKLLAAVPTMYNLLRDLAQEGDARAQAIITELGTGR